MSPICIACVPLWGALCVFRYFPSRLLPASFCVSVISRKSGSCRCISITVLCCASLYLSLFFFFFFSPPQFDISSDRRGAGLRGGKEGRTIPFSFGSMWKTKSVAGRGRGGGVAFWTKYEGPPAGSDSAVGVPVRFAQWRCCIVTPGLHFFCRRPDASFFAIWRHCQQQWLRSKQCVINTVLFCKYCPLV